MMQQMPVGEHKWETTTGLEDSTRTLILILLERMCGMMQEVRVRVGHGSDDPAHYFWSSKKTDTDISTSGNAVLADRP
jgi:hypothetical protein